MCSVAIPPVPTIQIPIIGHLAVFRQMKVARILRQVFNPGCSRQGVDESRRGKCLTPTPRSLSPPSRSERVPTKRLNAPVRPPSPNLYPQIAQKACNSGGEEKNGRDANPGRRSRVTAVTCSLCPGLQSVALTGPKAALRAASECPCLQRERCEQD